MIFIASFEDLTGKVYGRLTVIRRADDYISPSGYRRTKWLCSCECGNMSSHTASDLKRGDATSCGCYELESKRDRATTHGKTGTSLHVVWKGIKARCYNKNHKNYDRYGGRGIVMCDDWKNSFEAFEQWALQKGYKDGLTVDRIDNNGIYSPDNCRLVTRVAQANNRSNSIVVTYNGTTETLSWWSKELGIKYSTLYHRIITGWEPDVAFVK